MKGYLLSIVLGVVMLSLLELLLPEGEIKKAALTVMGLIAVTMMLYPFMELKNTLYLDTAPEMQQDELTDYGDILNNLQKRKKGDKFDEQAE